jgi:hypothetical protein
VRLGAQFNFGALKELGIKAFWFSVLSEFLCVGEAEQMYCKVKITIVHSSLIDCALIVNHQSITKIDGIVVSAIAYTCRQDILI